jgi:hypothetical protein
VLLSLVLGNIKSCCDIRLIFFITQDAVSDLTADAAMLLP